jgi:hypothetical protein
MDSYFLGIDIRIRMASRESSGNEKAIHFGIPSSGSLLETIKRFVTPCFPQIVNITELAKDYGKLISMNM